MSPVAEPILVLLVETHGEMRTVRLEGPPSAQLKVFQTIVGGYIEAIGPPTGWAAYINEDGKRLLLPPNPRAQAIMKRLGVSLFQGDLLVGPAVFFGRGRGPDETSVPERVIEAALAEGAVNRDAEGASR